MRMRLALAAVMLAGMAVASGCGSSSSNGSGSNGGGSSGPKGGSGGPAEQPGGKGSGGARDTGGPPPRGGTARDATRARAEPSPLRAGRTGDRSPLADFPWLLVVLIALFGLTARRLARLS